MYQLQFICPKCGAVYLLRKRFATHFNSHPFFPSTPEQVVEDAEPVSTFADISYPEGVVVMDEPVVWVIPPGPGVDAWALADARSRL